MPTLRAKSPRFGPSASNDAGNGATWMRPNRRCQIGATQISFNDRVRPQVDGEGAWKWPLKPMEADVRSAVRRHVIARSDRLGVRGLRGLLDWEARTGHSRVGVSSPGKRSMLRPAGGDDDRRSSPDCCSRRRDVQCVRVLQAEGGRSRACAWCPFESMLTASWLESVHRIGRT